ncbi:MAG: septum formation initiator family protein [bacterium]|nr:septum formation initiator family protein [bacterium]
MKRKRHKKKRRRWLFLLISCFGFCLFLFSYLFIFSETGYLVRLRLTNEIKDLEEKVQELDKENKLLKEKAENLRNRFYIEQKSREFGMIRPGEKIIKFVDREK